MGGGKQREVSVGSGERVAVSNRSRVVTTTMHAVPAVRPHSYVHVTERGVGGSRVQVIARDRRALGGAARLGHSTRRRARASRAVVASTNDRVVFYLYSCFPFLWEVGNPAKSISCSAEWLFRLSTSSVTAARCRRSMASRARVLALRLARDKWCVSRVLSRAFRPDLLPSPTAASCAARRRSGRSRAALASIARRARRDPTRFTPLTLPATLRRPTRRRATRCHAQGLPRVRGRRAVPRTRGGGRGGPGEKQRGPRAFPAGVRGGRGAARGGVLRRAVQGVGGEPRRVVAPRRAQARVARARPHPPGRPGARGVAAGVLERRAGVPRVRPPRRGAPRAPRALRRARAPSRRASGSTPSSASRSRSR